MVNGSAVDRPQFQYVKEILPAAGWKALLDEVRSYSERVEEKLRSLQENREHILAIIDLIPVAFFVKDHKSRFFLMNRTCEEQWGMSFADLRDTDASHLFPPDQMQQFLATDQSIFQGRRPVEFEETFWSAAKQENRIGYTFKRPMYDADGNPQYLVCVNLDITDRKRSEAALVDSEARLREAVTHSPNPVIMHAEDGHIIMTSAVLTEITGYSKEELPNIKTWAEKAYGIGAARMQRRIRTLFDLKSVRREGEFRIKTASGEIRLWEIQSQPLPKLPDGRRVVLSLGVDITDRKRMEKQLQALAETDSLTELPNRRLFLARLEDEFDGAQLLGGQRSSILMIDVDLFKLVNDTHGHAAGDAVLKHVAELMRNTLRRIDTIGRLGGEEFAVILPNTNSADARLLAERMREVVAMTPLVQDGETVSVTVSIGIATTDLRDSDAGDVLIRADDALYQAKKNGRNRVEVVEVPSEALPAMHKRLAVR